jgi:hypothetical protein
MKSSVSLVSFLFGHQSLKTMVTNCAKRWHVTKRMDLTTGKRKYAGSSNFCRQFFVGLTAKRPFAMRLKLSSQQNSYLSWAWRPAHGKMPICHEQFKMFPYLFYTIFVEEIHHNCTSQKYLAIVTFVKQPIAIFIYYTLIFLLSCTTCITLS